MTTTSFTIYGASDDLVEVEGAVREEYSLGRDGTRLRLTAPDGQSLGRAVPSAQEASGR
ncbi:hypothetical protein [Salana multivorans]